MLKERTARWQQTTNHTVALIDPIERSVCQVGEQDHGGEQVGQISFAMTEVVFEVIALGFECVIAFVLDLPAGAAGFGK